MTLLNQMVGRQVRRKRDKLMLKEDWRGLSRMFNMAHLSNYGQEVGMYKAILELDTMPDPLRRKALWFLKQKGSARMDGSPLPDRIEDLKGGADGTAT